MNPPPVPSDQLWRHFGLPAPAGDGWVEALVPLQFAAYALRDADGRPLGELNAPAPVREGVSFDVRPCPYADFRQGRPMNAGALRPVRDHLGWMRESIAVLRAAYARRHPATLDGLDLPHAWSFSAAVLALPFYLLRLGAAVDGTVPVEVGALYKVMQGVYMSAWPDWSAPAEPPSALVDPGRWVDRMFAKERLQHRQAGRVCAGPEPMIRELVAATVGPSRFEGPVEQAEGLMSYGCAWAALTLELWLLDPELPRAVPRVEAHRDLLVGHPADDETPEARITTLQQRLRELCGGPPPPGTFERAWRSRRR